MKRTGQGSAVEAVEACLSRIEALDTEIGAFLSLRPDQALAEAHQRDTEEPRGPLHGVPFAAKDIFDTAGLPTTYGSPCYRDHQPGRDAAAITLLKAAGAILIGKVSTVEFASVGAIPDTRNPHDCNRSPGGSSGGSGAAVAAGMVPLATATQTGGSTIRPASFCGVCGFKPTWGRVSTEGLKPFAPALDTVGWIAKNVDLLSASTMAFGIGIPNARNQDRPLRLGVFRTPYWDRAEADSRSALDKLSGMLEAQGHEVEPVAPVPGSERLNEWQDTLMHGEGGLTYRPEEALFGDRLHPRILATARNERGISANAMLQAYDELSKLRPVFDSAMRDYDAWLCPAVPGVAPIFSADDTGDAVFNRLFTALHVPCVTLPGFQGASGMPVGIQLVSGRYRDGELLNVAARIETLIQAAG